MGNKQDPPAPLAQDELDPGEEEPATSEGEPAPTEEEPAPTEEEPAASEEPQAPPIAAKGTSPAVTSGTSLLSAPPPPGPPQDLTPDQQEVYIRAAIHQDRSPGILVAVVHPGRMFKLPRGLFGAINRAGWDVRVVETMADRVRSVERIRDVLRQAASEGRPLDLMVVSGDGTLDHHVLVAAFWAFFPDLIEQKAGTIDTSAVQAADLAPLPDRYRAAFLNPMPDGKGLTPDEETIKDIWLLRAAVEPLLRKGRSVERVLRKSKRDLGDPVLRLAVLAALLPHKVLLRPHGFDVSGLAEASQERTFQGLFPYIRSICCFPAGTAADNAVFAGVPGWVYAQFAGLLTRFSWLEGLRHRWERQVVKRFLRYFTSQAVVVPARISIMGFDGQWVRLSSHAAGGPGAGHFFTADLTSKTKGMLGYLIRIPGVVLREGVFGSTVVRIASRFADGRIKSYTESQMAEGLYTNRAFIAGVGTIPTTGPTSLAGQSSLVVIPPILGRRLSGGRQFNLRGITAFTEAIVKGIAARAMHLVGLGVGGMAGGGRFKFLLPQHQVAIKEGEEIEIRYLTMTGEPRAVPIQVSGDPFQAWQMRIRSAWAPIPLLGEADSLLLDITRSTLADLHLRQSYNLRAAYIGGVHYFWYHLGDEWSEAFRQRTGLFQPPLHLPRALTVIQRRLAHTWREEGAGEFVDTSESGMGLGRRGRYAHNNDQSAHLVVLRERGGRLLLRQIRLMRAEGRVFENRTRYRAVGASYIACESSTVAWQESGPPTIIQDNHWFRSAQEFQKSAPAFFPMVASSSQGPGLLGGPETGLPPKKKSKPKKRRRWRRDR